MAEGSPRAEQERHIPGVFEDDDTLRRWFATELWPDPETSWFVFEPAPRQRPILALIAVDDLLIGVLWLEVTLRVRPRPSVCAVLSTPFSFVAA